MLVTGICIGCDKSGASARGVSVESKNHTNTPSSIAKIAILVSTLAMVLDYAHGIHPSMPIALSVDHVVTSRVTVLYMPLSRFRVFIIWWSIVDPVQFI